jgi:hypothetical protein
MSTRLGWWYASGPAELEYTAGDSRFNLHTVVADPALGHDGCVLVENSAGQQFPVDRKIIDLIGCPAAEV